MDIIYNGYDYAPLIVSVGIKEKYDIINTEMQEKFNSILEMAKGEIKTYDK